jgi:serine/threonine-protein phosphatase PGAM5
MKLSFVSILMFSFIRSLQFPPEAWLRFSLQHGSLTLLTICPDGRVFCSAIGEAGFIPTNKLSSK